MQYYKAVVWLTLSKLRCQKAYNQTIDDYWSYMSSMPIKPRGEISSEYIGIFNPGEVSLALSEETNIKNVA